MTRNEYLGFTPSKKNYKARLIISFAIIGIAAMVMLAQEGLKMRKANQEVSIRMARRIHRTLNPIFI